MPFFAVQPVVTLSPETSPQSHISPKADSISQDSFAHGHGVGGHHISPQGNTSQGVSPGAYDKGGISPNSGGSNTNRGSSKADQVRLFDWFRDIASNPRDRATRAAHASLSGAPSEEAEILAVTAQSHRCHRHQTAVDDEEDACSWTHSSPRPQQQLVSSETLLGDPSGCECHWMVCCATSDGTIIVRYEQSGDTPDPDTGSHPQARALPLVKQLRLPSIPTKRPSALSLDPSARWLVCVSHDFTIYVIPVLMLVQQLTQDGGLKVEDDFLEAPDVTDIDPREDELHSATTDQAFNQPHDSVAPQFLDALVASSLSADPQRVLLRSFVTEEPDPLDSSGTDLFDSVETEDGAGMVETPPTLDQVVMESSKLESAREQTQDQDDQALPGSEGGGSEQTAADNSEGDVLAGRSPEKAGDVGATAVVGEGQSSELTSKSLFETIRKEGLGILHAMKRDVVEKLEKVESAVGDIVVIVKPSVLWKTARRSRVKKVSRPSTVTWDLGGKKQGTDSVPRFGRRMVTIACSVRGGDKVPGVTNCVWWRSMSGEEFVAFASWTGTVTFVNLRSQEEVVVFKLKSAVLKLALVSLEKSKYLLITTLNDFTYKLLLEQEVETDRVEDLLDRLGKHPFLPIPLDNLPRQCNIYAQQLKHGPAMAVYHPNGQLDLFDADISGYPLYSFTVTSGARFVHVTDTFIVLISASGGGGTTITVISRRLATADHNKGSKKVMDPSAVVQEFKLQQRTSVQGISGVCEVGPPSPSGDVRPKTFYLWTKQSIFSFFHQMSAKDYFKAKVDIDRRHAEELAVAAELDVTSLYEELAEERFKVGDVERGVQVLEMCLAKQNAGDRRNTYYLTMKAKDIATKFLHANRVDLAISLLEDTVQRPQEMPRETLRELVKLLIRCRIISLCKNGTNVDADTNVDPIKNINLVETYQDPTDLCQLLLGHSLIRAAISVARQFGQKNALFESMRTTLLPSKHLVEVLTAEGLQGETLEYYPELLHVLSPSEEVTWLIKHSVDIYDHISQLNYLVPRIPLSSLDFLVSVALGEPAQRSWAQQSAEELTRICEITVLCLKAQLRSLQLIKSSKQVVEDTEERQQQLHSLITSRHGLYPVAIACRLALDHGNFRAAAQLCRLNGRWKEAVVHELRGLEREQAVAESEMLQVFHDDLVPMGQREGVPVKAHAEVVELFFGLWTKHNLSTQLLSEALVACVDKMHPALATLLANTNKTREYPLGLQVDQQVLWRVTELQLAKLSAEKPEIDALPVIKNLQAGARNVLVEIPDASLLSQTIRTGIHQGEKTAVDPEKWRSSFSSAAPAQTTKRISHVADCVAFTCGHSFGRAQFVHQILLKFQTAMDTLVEHQTGSRDSWKSLKELLLADYTLPVVSLACPPCVYNSYRDRAQGDNIPPAWEL